MCFSQSPSNTLPCSAARGGNAEDGAGPWIRRDGGTAAPHPRRTPSSPTQPFHSGFHRNAAPLPPFRGARVDLRLHPRHSKNQLSQVPVSLRGGDRHPSVPRRASGPPRHRRRVSRRRDRAPRALSSPHGRQATAATYGTGKMSPFGRRRPRCRPRCRCSALPAGLPGSAGRAGGAPTMPRAAARHIHRPPLAAGPSRSCRSHRCAPRSTHNRSRSAHGSPGHPSWLGQRCRGSQGLSRLSSRTDPGRQLARPG